MQQQNRKSKKKVNRAILITLILVVLILVVYPSFSRQKGYSSQKYMPTPSPFTYNGTSFEQAHSFLQDLFDGKIQYTNGEMKDSVRNVTFLAGNIDINAYKYESNNHKYLENYEGSEWEVDLSYDVKNFPLIKVGKQKLVTCAGYFECELSEVTGHKLGKRMWGSVEQFFQPGGAWNRFYYTYDEATQQIIYIQVNFYNISKFDVDDVFRIHPEIQPALDQVEEDVLTF